MDDLRWVDALGTSSGARHDLKVLHVGKYYPPNYGGIESHTQTLAQGLAENMNVEVVVSNPQSKETTVERDGLVELRRVGTLKTIAKAPLSPDIFSAVNASDADILHLHWPNPIGALAVLTDRKRRPLVVTYHSDVVRQKFLAKLFWPFLWLVLQRAEKIIVTSWRYVETSPILRTYADKCVSIPLGIPAVAHAQRSAVEAVRKTHAPNGEPLLLAVGRLVYYKGFNVLLDALAMVPKARLVLIGRGPDFAALKAQAHALDISHRVDFLSRVEDLSPYYAAADQFILPSNYRSEAFGLVQVEAMQQGTPVINTALDTAVPEVSLHLQTGLTVQPSDPRGLADAIQTLISDPALAERMGEAGRYRAAKLFSAQAMVGATKRCYLGLRRRAAALGAMARG